MEAVFRALIHGESGAGKSRLADTAPGPRLIVDLEGRAQYLPSGPKVYWDPKAGGPPAADGTWDTCIVFCADFETLNLVYQWLRSGQHPFVSVIIDSLMEAQKRCIDAVVPGVAQLDQQNWGELLRRLEKLVRSYRDLTLLTATNAVRCVIFTAGSRHDETVGWEPMLQGQLADLVPYYMDVVGYLYKQPMPDGTFQRSLLVDKTPGFVAKDNTSMLVAAYGPTIAVPDGDVPVITQLMQLLSTTMAGGVPVGEGATA